jgi:hypothetical protein
LGNGNAIFILCFRNRRRSEINQSELQAIASQHSHDGEEQGEEFGSDGGAKDEDQRSLLGSSCEDVNELEAERDRDDENNEASGRRTVLHTYNVFISNIRANEKCQVSNSSDHHHHGNNSLSIIEKTSEEEHCHIDILETDLAGNGDVSTAIELPGDSHDRTQEGVAEREGEGRREGERPAAAAREEVKPGWREKIKRGIKTSLADLKLFLW